MMDRKQMTANLGAVSHPFFSPDGQWLAFWREQGGYTD